MKDHENSVKDLIKLCEATSGWRDRFENEFAIICAVGKTLGGEMSQERRLCELRTRVLQHLIRTIGSETPLGKDLLRHMDRINLPSASVEPEESASSECTLYE